MPDMFTKRFFPVIHCVDPYARGGVGHALSNARIAYNCYLNGVSGIFLIGHGLSAPDLLYIYEQVRKQFPKLWIGVNFLDVAGKKDWQGLTAWAKRCIGLNALWIDSLPDTRLDLSPSIEVFGGVAFKYIDEEIRGEQLIASCKKAIEVVDVITTSGAKTGSAPDVSKLEEIRAILGNAARLALASGVNWKNIDQFKMVNDFIVASSIISVHEDEAEYFCEADVIKLAEAIQRL